MGRGRARKCSLGLISAVLSYLTIYTLYTSFGNETRLRKAHEELQWVNTSSSWIDRQSCRWIGICGAFHLRSSGWRWKTQLIRDQQESSAEQSNILRTPPDISSFWTSGDEKPESWSADERALRDIPSYVYDYTPYVHLFSGEEFWPGDIAEHLVHTTPYLNYTPIEDLKEKRNLENLDELNQYGNGRQTYLQSDDNVEERPQWLGGRENIPTMTGKTYNYSGPLTSPPDYELPNVYDSDWWDVGEGDIIEHGGLRPNPTHAPGVVPRSVKEELKKIVHPTYKIKSNHTGGHSSAPAVLVVVPKANGVVDAFWFYFYSYNLGNVVLNTRFGNHIGDWEHSVVRFQHGKPKALFLSEHNFGEAYAYKAVEKIGKRPVIYSAVGTHAMYATAGVHPYVLPWGLLHDETDKGPLWDPIQNHHAYVYNHTSNEVKSSTRTPKAPISWFNFGGHWGDKTYPLSDPRQYRFAGQYHYVSGPYGPKFKNLGRQKICQGNGKCTIKHWIGNEKVKRTTELDHNEDLAEMHLDDA
ncbi:hypothetical protein AAFC00_005313 [Neodothiora populina]|uniref:Uncharacterized protein n=1 Tax=Neodothiora populina TaxID=2781224 RepID=A0ABR3PKQ2_9PEZI